MLNGTNITFKRESETRSIHGTFTRLKKELFMERDVILYECEMDALL